MISIQSNSTLVDTKPGWERKNVGDNGIIFYR